jgi:hypothetical protein
MTEGQTKQNHTILTFVQKLQSGEEWSVSLIKEQDLIVHRHELNMILTFRQDHLFLWYNLIDNGL